MHYHIDSWLTVPMSQQNASIPRPQSLLVPFRIHRPVLEQLNTLSFPSLSRNESARCATVYLESNVGHI